MLYWVWSVTMEEVVCNINRHKNKFRSKPSTREQWWSWQLSILSSILANSVAKYFQYFNHNSFITQLQHQKNSKATHATDHQSIPTVILIVHSFSKSSVNHNNHMVQLLCNTCANNNNCRNWCDFSNSMRNSTDSLN